MAIVKRIDHRHGTRQGPFDRLLGLLAQELGVFDEHGLAARHGAHDRRHAGIVAVADPDRLAVLEINAFQVLDKRRHEMLTRLFAIADDIDAGVLLFLQRQTQRILLAFGQALVLQFPGRPEFFRFCEPGGFRQAAGSGSR